MSSADEELLVGHQWDYEDSSEEQSDKTTDSPVRFSLRSEQSQQQKLPSKQYQQSTSNVLNDDPKKPLLHNNETERFYGNKYRYMIGILIIATRFFQSYIDEALVVASISMVSSGALESGINQIRAETWGPTSNVASPGTCPLYLKDEKSSRRANYSFSAAHLESKAEASLVQQVRDKLERGELVDWNINQRAWIISAHDIGSSLGLLMFSCISLKYGEKKIYGIGLIASTTRGFLFPAVAAHAPYWFTLTFEILMGMLHASSTSVYMTLIGAWFLPPEASTMIGLYFSAIILAPEISGFFTSQLIGWGFGWPVCFYLPAIMLLKISIAWLLYGMSRPEESSDISHDEQLILEGSVANKRAQLDRLLAKQSPMNDCCCDPSDPNCPGQQMKRMPLWTVIFTCPTIWALAAAEFNIAWVVYTLSLLPTFLATVQHASTWDIGLIMALSAIFGIIYLSAFAYLTRKFPALRPGGISLTMYRRLNGAMASLLMSIVYLLLMVFDCSLTMVAIARIILPVCGGFHMTASEQMPLDISPADGGLIKSVVESMSSHATFLAPLAAGRILSATNGKVPPASRQAWRIVWLLAMAVNLITCGWFTLFSRSEPKNYTRLQPVGKCKSKQPSQSDGPFSNPKRYNWHIDDRRYV